MINTNYLRTCVPTHKVIQNKNKYITHNDGNIYYHSVVRAKPIIINFILYSFYRIYFVIFLPSLKACVEEYQKL